MVVMWSRERADDGPMLSQPAVWSSAAVDDVIDRHRQQQGGRCAVACPVGPAVNADQDATGRAIFEHPTNDTMHCFGA